MTEQVNEREQFYNKVVIWAAIGPFALVLGLTAVMAYFNPSMFGF